MRIAVFASGRGSNFKALLEARKSGRLPEAEFALLFSNKPDAKALDIARDAGIEALHLAPKAFESRAAFEVAVVEALREHRIEAICLAGYMLLVGQGILDAFPNRILNIHPALLPSFPGLHGQQQAWEHGVKVSGCTVHLVDLELDHGPIVVQRTVPVIEGDDEDRLSARILEQEHLAYPQALSALLVESWVIEGRRVVFG